MSKEIATATMQGTGKRKTIKDCEMRLKKA
jgi:hypothetical protein